MRLQSNDVIRWKAKNEHGTSEVLCIQESCITFKYFVSIYEWSGNDKMVVNIDLRVSCSVFLFFCFKLMNLLIQKFVSSHTPPIIMESKGGPYIHTWYSRFLSYMNLSSDHYRHDFILEKKNVVQVVLAAISHYCYICTALVYTYDLWMFWYW